MISKILVDPSPNKKSSFVTFLTYPETNVSSTVSLSLNYLWCCHLLKNYFLFLLLLFFLIKNFFFFTDYSCALVGDIFLQGNLYVTYNYFAFHSNVFGYVRKVSWTRNQYCKSPSIYTICFVKSPTDTNSYG